MNTLKVERLNEDRACRFRRITGDGFRLAIEITRRCNLSCKHCFVQSDKNDSTIDEITDIIQQAGRLNCKKLIISGGEPLLRNDLEQIVSVATREGILVDINSNLLLLTKERIEALVTAGLQEVSTSLYGTEKFHDEMTGQKGSFDRVLKGINLCREVGITVDVHGAIWNNMLSSIKNLIDTVQKYDVSSITFFSVIPTEKRNYNKEEYALCPNLAYKTILQMRELFSIPIRTVGLRSFETNECVMGNGIYGIGADMRLKPCLLSCCKNKCIGIDLRSHSLQKAISLLDSQIKHGEWNPVCNPSIGADVNV